MKKYKCGYTVGVFDLFHVGHLNLLERCKEYCDKLVVGICNDDYVRIIKHKEPCIHEEDRARIVKALKCVDDVIITTIEETEDKKLVVDKVNYDVLFSGSDWKGTERYNIAEKEFKKLNIDIVYLPYTQGVSTSDIRKKIEN